MFHLLALNMFMAFQNMRIPCHWSKPGKKFSGRNNVRSSVKTHRKSRITDQKSNWKSHINQPFHYLLSVEWKLTGYFFKKLQVFLFLLIPILHFVLLFIKDYVYFHFTGYFFIADWCHACHRNATQITTVYFY